MLVLVVHTWWKALLQTPHLNCFSELCVSKWFFMLPRWWKPFPHTSHLNGL